MQRKLDRIRRSEEEMIKDAGLVLDFDEIGKRDTLTKEEKLLAKGYGVYSSRQTGDHMVRITCPGGVYTSAQVRGLVEISRKYAQDLTCITTRQSVQMHKIQCRDLASFMRDLAKHDLTSWHGCGDNTRNVAACPWATDCEHARVDVLPYALQTSDKLNFSADLNNMPRKFKVTFSGCGAGCAQPHMNCVGVIAVQRGEGENKEVGFKVKIGGGMGWKAFVAQELFSWVPEDKVVDLCRAIALLFRDHGDRFNRAKSRLKFVVHRYGIAKCREIVLENLNKEGISTEGIETGSFEETGAPIPDRPLAEIKPIGTDGKAIARIMVPKGEIKSADLLRVAELAEIYGDKKVHNTNRQNLEIHGVEPSRLDELNAEVAKLGFATEGFFGLPDIVPCVGVTYCPLAVSTTRNMYDLLQPLVKNDKYTAIREKAIINITGCPNSCSPYRISDIGLRGLRVREKSGSTEGYQILVGGYEHDYGILLGEFKAADCVKVVEIILDSFLELREGDESLSDNIRRVGVDTYKERVYA